VALPRLLIWHEPRWPRLRLLTGTRSQQAAIVILSLLSQRIRALEELAARPHLVRALADRHRLAEQQAEAEREERLVSGALSRQAGACWR
jgi:hypothetical protein